MRISGESRTSTAVVDPTAGTYTEINEWGPEVTGAELETLMEKLHYLSRGADFVVLAGSLPRKVPTSFYGDAIRDLSRRDVRVVLDSEGAALQAGVEAAPFLVSPNQAEAEQLVGQELEDDDDFLMALDAIAEMGPRNVVITLENGCFALLRYRAQDPPLARVCALRGAASRGSGPATCCSRSSSPRSSRSGRSTRRCAMPWLRARRRCGRSAPAASTRSWPPSMRRTSRSPSSSPPSAQERNPLARIPLARRASIRLLRGGSSPRHGVKPALRRRTRLPLGGVTRPLSARRPLRG